MPIPNPAHIEELIQTVAAAPFPSHMSMRLAAIEFERATIELELGHCHLQPYGIVHGGVLATLIDTATFWAAYLRIPADDGLVNVDLKLNYLKPVINGRLKAEGHCLRPGRSISYAEATVMDEKGEIVCHGTSTLMALTGKSLRLAAQKFIDETGGNSK